MWECAVQVQQGVHLDGGLAPAKLRPRKQRQAQVDGGRIQSVQTLLQIDANRIAGMQRPGDGDQNLREVGVDPPVACFVGISQGRARHLAAESHVVELAADGTKARFDVAKTLAVRTPSPDTDPNRTNFSDSDHPRSGLRTSGTLGEEGTRSVGRRRCAQHSSRIVTCSATDSVKYPLNAVSISNRFNANTHASH